MNVLMPRPYPGKSIAVLPFVNMSKDPENEYFSDGVTEEIINALTKIDGLKVIARTSSFSYKKKNIDIRTIGSQLGVNTILEGSVRKAKNRIRITAQLIRTDDGSHLWSKNYDREMQDIFELQDEISLLIADKIRENFGHLNISDHLVYAPTKDLESYNLYLKGRFFHLKWDEKPIQQAIKYYQAAIEKDPNFVLPYFGIAYCLILVAAWSGKRELFELASSYLNKGLAIEKKSFFGHFVCGALKYWRDWDYEGGIELYRKSVEINPHFTEGYDGIAEILLNVGQFEEALSYINRSIALSPRSANHFYTKGAIYFYSGNYQEALHWLKASQSVDPDFPHPKIKIALCYILLKQEEELLTHLSSSAGSIDAKILAQINKLHLGKPVEQKELGILLKQEQERKKISLWAGSFYLLLLSGKTREAFDKLKVSVDQRLGTYPNFRHFPFIEPLKQLPAFRKLAALSFSLEAPTPTVDKKLSRPPDSSFFSPSEVSTYLQQLRLLMTEQQLYTESDLNLRVLAERLELHPNKLSWLINEHIGKNFKEYINTLRSESFKTKALDPANSHLTLLGLAYESGFNSKTVFNAFFKKTEGMTPREWVRLNKN